MNSDAQSLHDLYCRATGIHLPWSFARQYAWDDWAHSIATDIANSEWPGASPLDVLRVVIEWRKKVCSKPEIRRAWLAFARVTRRPDECIEDYAAAQAERRPKPQYSQGKADVLRATGRPSAPEPPPARPSKELVEKFLGDLKRTVR